ncbi:YibE/F family protein [uncultured Tolumonas sp.]|uniref:YibE/F family protein n=1 Tax=uncultured Tolumonas sp. TaxID=263765 RepID=UPI00292DA239|nr:YibE/F family protein [uncultured Tolumonas sp.]
MNKSLMLLTALLAALLLGWWQHSAVAPTDGVQELRAEVVKTDNSRLVTQGQARLGSQLLSIRLKNGEWPERQLDNVVNIFNGTMEFDEYYEPGDSLIVAVRDMGYGQLQAQVVARDRLVVLGILFSLLVVSLLMYARKTGLRALLSFVGSVLILWQLLIPRLLAGGSAVLWSSLCVVALVVLILGSVAGFSRKSLAALIGTLLGLVLTGLLAWWACQLMHLDGMTQVMAQSLFFETGMTLDLRQIFCAAIIIGASGAAMDVAIEMAATMEEIHRHRPDLTAWQLLSSGFNVGNVVIGTMTTTLLLAYSGGFLTLMMMFSQRQASLLQILNLKLVAAELARILVGSCSLVIVAPLTAWIAAGLYCGWSVKQTSVNTADPLSEPDNR